MMRSTEHGRGSVVLRLLVLTVLLLSAGHGYAIAFQPPAEPSAADSPPMELTPEQKALIEKLQSIQWQSGPTKGGVGTLAEVSVPEGFNYVGADGAQTLLEAYGNPRNPKVLAAIVPQNQEQDWTLIFQFDDIGYVKDADKESINADELLEGFNAGLADGNERRRAVGAEEIQKISWTEQPFYDKETNNLTWAMLASFASGDSVNYDIRILGRHGVMEATIVGSPESYKTAVPEVKKILSGFTFTDGNKYAEWQPGDRMAQLGLAGLIGGGAVAVAGKAGLLGKLGAMIAKGGKAIIVVVLGLGAMIWSLIKKMLGMGEKTETGA